MRFAKSETVPTGPTNLYELFKLDDRFIGRPRMLLETAGTVNYGTKNHQPGLVGTRLELLDSNPKDVFVTAADVVLTLVIE